MTNEVWVCMSSEFARGTRRAFTDKKFCPANHNGICGTDKQPCDAKRFVEATIPALRAALELEELRYTVTIKPMG